MYNTSIKDKNKKKWLEKYKKTDHKVTLPYIQGLSKKLKSSLKIFNINAYLKNNHTLENLLMNKKDTDAIENSSNFVYTI